jgi:hypothetical protein
MATKQKLITRDKLLRMREGLVAEPIIDNPALERMPDAPEPPRKIGGRILLMDAGARVPYEQGSRMKPVPSKMQAETGRPKRDQANAVAESAESPGSVRLRLRIDRGQVTVVGARSVPGAAPVPERLDYGLAYEIMNGTRRVAVGSIPDVGTQRSFPDPKGRQGMEGHHLAELQSFEINVRLPQHEISEAALPRLRVTFYRMKGQPPAVPITSAPLFEQLPDQLRPVAELRGIDLNLLPTAVRGEMRKAIKAPRKTRQR